MHTADSSRWTSVLALLLYVTFVAYQSLADGGAWACHGPLLSLPRRASRSDVLANVVAYVPLGLLFVWAFSRRWASDASAETSSLKVMAMALMGIAATTCVSASMELVQACQDRRVSSAFDLAANALGGALGVLAAIGLQTIPRRRSSPAASPLTTPDGRLQLLTALVALVWILSQTMPWVFAADVGTIRSNLSFLKRFGEQAFDTWRWLRHAGAWMAIACACRLAGRDARRGLLWLVVSGAISLVLQVLLDARAPLSIEELAGMTTAAVVVLPLWRAGSGWPAGLLAGSALAVAAYELRAEPGAAVQAFSWWPRVGLGGLLGALDYALFFGWFGLTAVVGAQWATARGGRYARQIWPLAAVAITLALEVVQTTLPGRGPDLSASMFTLLAVLLATSLLVDGARPMR